MTRKERYKDDLAYRLMVNKDNRDRYHRNMKDTTFAKLHAVRCRISNARISIAHHETKLKFFFSRIAHDSRLLEKLQKEWENKCLKMKT